MKITYPFRHVCMAFITIFITSLCFAQDSIRVMKDSTGLHSYSAVRGDTLLIAYDSAFILNKITYKLYKDNYTRVLNKDPATKNLIKNYESLIALQDSMLKAKEEYYQQLKGSFDSLSSTSSIFAERTEANAKEINASLDEVNNNLHNINALLDDSLEKLKKQNQQKIKVAIGGFSIGVVVTGLVFLIAK